MRSVATAMCRAHSSRAAASAPSRSPLPRRRRDRVQERIRDAHEGRGGDDAVASRPIQREKTDDARDGAGIGECGSPELVDDDGTCLGGHA